MHQLILQRPLVGAHRAGTDVDGLVDIFCDKRVTSKLMVTPSAIPLASWLAHSNHSKARLEWEAKMKAEVEAERMEGISADGAAGKTGETAVEEEASPAIIVGKPTDAESDDGGESSDGRDSVAEMAECLRNDPEASRGHPC